MIRAIFALLALVLITPSARASCRQALALGLDVSGSVDQREYQLQRDGLATALLDPRVQNALFGLPSAPVALSVFEWSGPDYQRILIDWTLLHDAATLTQVAARLSRTPRSVTSPGTALGTAMQFGAAHLAAGPECWAQTLDISGDGKHNLGPHPRDIRSVLKHMTPSFTLNALVIGADAPRSGERRQTEIAELTAYFDAWVIMGADAFVETALGFGDYQAAMTRKLLRELQGPVLSALPVQPIPGQ